MKRYLLINAMIFSAISVMLSGCLLGKISAPDLPAVLNKPSPVTMTEINGVKLGLPKGWKSVKLSKNSAETGGVIQLEHGLYGSIIIFKAPTMADARYGKLFTKAVVETVLPDYEEKGGEHAVSSGAVIQIYKGSMNVGGDRGWFNAYTTYSISQGLSEYFMYSLILDVAEKESAFFDFIAVANSL